MAMVYQKFYTNVIIRTVSITFTGLVLAYVVMKRDDLYVAFNVLLLIMVQTVLMIQYLNRINRDLAHFFNAISNDDSNVVYRKTASGKTFQVLHESFDQINARIQALKMENSRRTFYLQHLVEHAGIGIISYAGNGKIDIFNPAARKLLNISSGVTVQKINELNRMTGLALGEIRPGEKRLLKANLKNDSIPLSVMASDFVFRGETTRLLTFQGIKSELEDNEMVSWQKLIKTLTHEIVNSIGPISSTNNTMKSF
ncbi:MAG: hypothetical protein JXA72_05865 [Bacteroidales bacterium]|nr:hypothetical protein [Bacteroidales bacterium]